MANENLIEALKFLKENKEYADILKLLEDKDDYYIAIRRLNAELKETRQWIEEINKESNKSQADIKSKEEALNTERTLLLAILNLEKERNISISSYQKAQLKKIDEEHLKRLKEIEQEGLSAHDAALATEEADRERKRKEDEIRNNPMAIWSGGLFSGGDNSSPLGKLINNIGNEVLKSDSKEQGFAKVIDVGIDKLKDKFPGLGNIASILVQGFAKLQSKLADSIKDAVNIFKEYLGPINTRLQGTEKTFDSLLDVARNNLAANQYINQKDYIQKMASLVEQGIAYNLEERSLWATVGEKIATTFDVLDQTLTRLIRLQQFDMTRSSLGAEARMTELLNRVFNDTSYLSSGGGYDAVNQALIEATSQMNPDQATSFMFNVQKWLGALYSVGMSNEGVQSLARGINYLSTGDISSLSSNQQLQTLLGLALSRSGQSLSSLLSSGMQAEDVDILMKSIVEYLATIADNTDSQVLKNQWAQVLGVTMSDLRAMSNLNEGDIASLLGSTVTQEEAYNEVDRQIREYFTERTSIQERAANVLDNMFLTFGQNLAENDKLYIAYVTGQAIDKLGSLFPGIGGAIVTAIGDLTTGISEVIAGAKSVYNLKTSLKDLSFPDILSGYFHTDANSWKSLEYNRTERGKGFLGLIPSQTNYNYSYSEPYDAVTTTTSSSVSMAKGIESIENLSATEQSIEESGKDIVGQQEEISDTIDKIYEMLFENQSTPLKIKLADIDDEALELLNKILARNKQELSSDIERYMGNNSSSVESLTNMLYAIRSV